MDREMLAQMLRRFLWVLLVSSGACQGSGKARPDAISVSLSESPSICRDCIHLEKVAVLGSTNGPGFLESRGGLDVVRDKAGRYWVGQPDGLKVFDQHGRYLRTVGRSGQGPMEFQFADPIYVDSSDRVHILDQARETVVDDTFGLVSTRRLPGPQILRAAPIERSDRYVANMWIPTDSGWGRPLHVIEGPNVVLSFGEGGDTTTSRGVAAFRALRVLAAGERGDIYSAPYFEYHIKIWDVRGDLLKDLQGPTLNDQPVQPGSVTFDNPPPSQILALHADSAGHLWILIRQRNASWRHSVSERVDRKGHVYLDIGADNYYDIFSGRIDVVDLKSGTIIGSDVGRSIWTSFVDDSHIAERHDLEDGTPQVVIWKVAYSDRT